LGEKGGGMLSLHSSFLLAETGVDDSGFALN
jgi:hypothetical protein